MSEIRLPKKHRPINIPYRKCQIGIDLPMWFIDGLKAIDPKIYPVWHEYDLLWDMVINEGIGSVKDPRFHIHYRDGHLNFGHVLTLGDGRPKKDQHWHLWRLSDYGWSHIIKLESNSDPEYLKTVLDRLYFHATYDDKYGRKKLNKKLFEEQEELQKRKLEERYEKQRLLDKENKKIWSEVMDNFTSGKIKPTRPVKEIIMSYPKQSNRTKIERIAEDKEIGIYNPED